LAHSNHQHGNPDLRLAKALSGPASLAGLGLPVVVVDLGYRCSGADRVTFMP